MGPALFRAAMAATFAALGGCTLLEPLDGLFCDPGEPCVSPAGDAGADGRAPTADAATEPEADGTLPVDQRPPPDATPSCGDGGCAGGCDGPTCPLGLHVLYVSRDPEPVNKRARMDLRIVNPTAQDVPLPALKLRYYFSVDNGRPQLFECVFISAGTPPFHCRNVVGTIVRLPPDETRATATHALELTFTAEAGTLAAHGGDTSEMNVSFRAEDSAEMNQANDYSFEAAISAARPHDRVTLHRDDQLVWGRAP